ncbi:hypothetical protein BVX98_03515, partial [bacterium F11]
MPGESLATNTPAVAWDQEVDRWGDAPFSFRLEVSDVDGDELDYFQVSENQPYGSFIKTNNLEPPNIELIYFPNSHYKESDYLEYKVFDGLKESRIATVIVNYKGPDNQPPEAFNQTVIGVEGEPFSITLNAYDPENNILTYNIVQDPEHGTLFPAFGKNLTYTPNVGLPQQDTFKFQVSDIQNQSNVATVYIEYESLPNQAPTATPKEITVNAGEPHSFQIEGSDVDDDPEELTYILTTWPQHGQLEGTGPELTYTAQVTYEGEDQFKFRVTDGRKVSEEALVTIDVLPPIVRPNEPPEVVEITGKLNIFINEVTTLTVVSQDDGYPLPPQLTYRWWSNTNPELVHFGQPHAAETTVY